MGLGKFFSPSNHMVVQGAPMPPSPGPCLCHPSLGSLLGQVLLFPCKCSPSSQIIDSCEPAAHPCSAGEESSSKSPHGDIRGPRWQWGLGGLGAEGS